MSKVLYSAIAVVGIAAASAGAWWLMSKPTAPREIGVAAAAPGPGAPSAGAAPAGAAGAAGGPARPVGVEVAKVETSAVQDDAQAVGTLRSRQNVMLRPEVAGRVKEIGFADGAVVRKGQVLVQLDDSLARAELEQAKANQKLAKAKFDRAVELQQKNFISGQARDEAENALRVADATVSLAEAKLTKLVIKSPFSGTVGLRSASVGDYVKDGQDIVNLEKTDPIKVEHALNPMVPAGERGRFSLRLILHGRRVCFARKPACDACVLASFCPSAGQPI